jgi:preprotein translocase subunit SecF
MNLIGKRKIWYAISIIMILPGVASLALFGLNLGIDFKSGEVSTVSGTVAVSEVTPITSSIGLKDVTVVSLGSNQTEIRYSDPSSQASHEANHQKLKAALAKKGITELSFDSVGPSVSKSIATNAIAALLAASLAIVLYVAYAFRNAPRPVSPWSFGVMAIIALLHEIDALFVTAILTVIGFSVHDTIVVFDRIRENLRRRKGSFEDTVNASILETLARSINTSLTVILTLLALFLFGGQSIRLFVLALLIGIASGTYSSIFNASPLLVTWHNYKLKRDAKK